MHTFTTSVTGSRHIMDKMPGPAFQKLEEWNQSTADYPREACVHQLLEMEAARRPDSIAAEFKENSLTYAELHGRANQLAHLLRSLGAGRETLVGLCMERS